MRSSLRKCEVRTAGTWEKIIMKYRKKTRLTGACFRSGHWSDRGFLALSSAAAAGVVFFSRAALGAADTWSATAATGNWSPATNWATDTTPANGDTLTFGASSTTALTDDISGLSVSGITFVGSTSYTIGGDALDIASGGLSVDVGTNSAGSTLTLALAPSAGSSGGLTVTSTGGGGALALQGANTFTGPTTVNSAATLSELTFNTGSSITLNSGEISYTGSTTASMAGGNGLAVNGTSTVNVSNSSGVLAIYTAGPNSLTGTGTLIKTGDGLLEISGPNVYQTFDGLVVIDAGTVDAFGGGSMTRDTFAANAWTVNDGGTLEVSYGGGSMIGANNGIELSGNASIDVPSATHTFNDVIADAASAGTLIKTGAGTMVLGVSNSYSGGTVVDAGTLTVGAQLGLGSTTGGLAVNNPNTGAGTAVTLNLFTTAATVTGPLSGAIAPAGSGTNTATINTGTSQNFTVNQTAAGTYAGTIAGSGSFTLGSLSTSSLTLTGVSSYTGPTTISAGTIVAGTVANGGANSPLGAGTSLNFGGGSFEYTGSTASTDRTISLTGTGGTVQVDTAGQVLTLAGSVSGNGALTVAGNGTIALTNSTVNFTGATTVNGNATLSESTFNTGSPITLNSSGAISYTGSATASMAAREGLAVNGTNTVNVSDAAGVLAIYTAGVNSLTGTGTLIKTGPGLLEISGPNVSQDFNGLVVINGGTVDAYGGGSMTRTTAAANAWTVNDGGTLELSYPGGSFVPANNGIQLSGNAYISTSSTAGTHVIVGVIADGSSAGALIKTGAATLDLSGVDTYSNGTTISSGALLANSSNSTGAGTVTVSNGAVLGGIGAVQGSITVSSGGILTAGSVTSITPSFNPTSGEAPNKLTANTSGTTVTLNSGSNFDVKVDNVSGSPGSGWDEVVMNALSVGSGATINLYGLTSGNTGGMTPGFSSSTPFTLTIATLANTTQSALQADLADFTLNTSNFTNNNTPGSGFTFSLAAVPDFGTSGSDLEIVYSATPEPGTAMLLLAGAMPMLWRRRRRHNDSRRP
jgi:fibronectin-binding autotransporter adhesin